jgi:hypothetical protein
MPLAIGSERTSVSSVCDSVEQVGNATLQVEYDDSSCRKRECNVAEQRRRKQSAQHDCSDRDANHEFMALQHDMLNMSHLPCYLTIPGMASTPTRMHLLEGSLQRADRPPQD